MAYHISHYKLSNFTEPPHHIILKTKKTMIAAEVAVLTQTLALLASAPTFGKVPKIPKCFATAV